MKSKAVIVDIDGVLAEKSPKRDYTEYDKVHLDKPIIEMFRLLEYFSESGYKILLVTGRKEYCRNITQKWIIRHFNKCASFCKIDNDDFEDRFEMFMRIGDVDTGDHRKAPILKKEIYDKYIKQNYDIVMAIDDDPNICQMWRNEGFLTLEVKR